MELSDDELLWLSNSAGITVKVLAKKEKRVKHDPHEHAETLADLEIGRELKHKLDTEHSKRLGLVP